MDSSKLTGWPKPAVGRMGVLGQPTTPLPGKISRLKAPAPEAPESTVKGSSRGNSRSR